MATSDADIALAVSRYLQMTQDIDTIKSYADQFFAEVQDGRTVTSVSFEGGSASAMMTRNPAVLLNACMDALAALGEPTAQSAVSRSIFPRFGAQNIQT